jgi:hypothetical protein
MGKKIFETLDIPRLVRIDRLNGIINMFIENHWYDSIVKLLEEPIFKFQVNAADYILKHQENQINAARLLFDYGRVQSLCQSVLRNSPQSHIKNRFSGLLKKYALLARAQNDENWWKEQTRTRSTDYFSILLTFLEEVIWNLKVKLQQAAYTDALGRIFRFLEATTRLLIERIWNFSTDIDKTRKHGAFHNFLKQNEEIFTYLRDENIQDIESIDLNNLKLIKLLNFILDKGMQITLIPEKSVKNIEPAQFIQITIIDTDNHPITLTPYCLEKLFVIEKVFGLFMKYDELRNKSILAHGFICVNYTLISSKIIESSSEFMQSKYFNQDSQFISAYTESLVKNPIHCLNLLADRALTSTKEFLKNFKTDRLI